jgi:hypothetical protein
MWVAKEKRRGGKIEAMEEYIFRRDETRRDKKFLKEKL